MSIPLDRLYHYIESVAQDVYGDTVIYHFYPHGSKKIEDLHTLHLYPSLEYNLWPLIYCYDQEPLNFDLYQDIPVQTGSDFDNYIAIKDSMPRQNLRYKIGNIYDQSILLHSEQRSAEVKKYQNNNFIPVYYWSHALIALDWYRFAYYYDFSKDTNSKNKFLIYNRAWSGTREYRIKFAEHLVKNNLHDKCKISFNPVESETKIHYCDYDFINKEWQTNISLEDYFSTTIASGHASADFVIQDYKTSDIEVVLETLFDDQRLHLTEKILRPIACQQPFIVAGTHGSLKYLQNYGFKTFDPIIDESYDLIENPYDRMKEIIKTMKKISKWTFTERTKNLEKLHEICKWNKEYFFSDRFFNKIVNELQHNLKLGLDTLNSTNTGLRYINSRKQMYHDNNLNDYWNANRQVRKLPEQLKNLQRILTKARSYSTKNK